MTARSTVILSNDDGLAALQILAHLAYPHRPDFGLKTLLQWARHRANASPREKWSRLEPKLWRLDDMVKRRLKGSYWLRWQTNKAAAALYGGPASHAKGLREAARGIASREQKVENVIRDYWQQTRRVAHLGLATGDSILLAYPPSERWPVPQWNLTRVAFQLDWVERALQHAELNAQAADRFGIIPLLDATHFARDNI